MGPNIGGINLLSGHLHGCEVGVGGRGAGREEEERQPPGVRAVQGDDM